jgi:hypothetical protein
MSSANNLVEEFVNSAAEVMVSSRNTRWTVDSRIGIYTIDEYKYSEKIYLEEISFIDALEHLVIVADYYRDQEVTIYYGHDIWEALYGTSTSSQTGAI